jgi:DNA-binding transcriptional ArsR family regulator
MNTTAHRADVPGRLDATFAALADSTRRAILARLAQGEVSVMELAQPFAMSQPAISKHLKVLERAGLVARGRDGQRRPCRLTARPLAEAEAWLDAYRRYWEASFAGLDAVLEELKASEARGARRPESDVGPRVGPGVGPLAKQGEGQRPSTLGRARARRAKRAGTQRGGGWGPGGFADGAGQHGPQKRSKRWR